MKITYIVGENVKKFRKEKKISQMELADMCNISVSCLSRIEKGFSKMQLAHINKIALALGVPTVTLLEMQTTRSERKPIYINPEKFSAVKTEFILAFTRNARFKLAYDIEQLFKKASEPDENEDEDGKEGEK